jgi:hypothetical protein
MLRIAAKLGVPTATIADLIRTVLHMQCAFCEYAGVVLKHVKELGEDRVVDLLGQIIEAKRNKDIGKLEQLKKEFDGNK